MIFTLNAFAGSGTIYTLFSVLARPTQFSYLYLPDLSSCLELRAVKRDRKKRLLLLLALNDLIFDENIIKQIIYIWRE